MTTVLALSLAGLALAQGARSPTADHSAGVKLDVTIQGLPAQLGPKEPLIRNHILCAARTWTDLVDAKPCSIEIVFHIEDVVDGDAKKLGHGKSVVSHAFEGERKDDKLVSEQGLAAELRTGKDPNGDAPDVDICFQTAYVLREFWWDPDPATRKHSVPSDKLDAQSAILHELGHALAFNGWRDHETGKLEGTHMSTYDRWVECDGRDFWFKGPAALKAHGKPVLLAHTVNNYHHVGEERDDVKRERVLQDDVMTGYHFQWGKHYVVGPIDVAILEDCGIPLKK
jgi:hypothetical protein